RTLVGEQVGLAGGREAGRTSVGADGDAEQAARYGEVDPAAGYAEARGLERTLVGVELPRVLERVLVPLGPRPRRRLVIDHDEAVLGLEQHVDRPAHDAPVRERMVDRILDADPPRREAFLDGRAEALGGREDLSGIDEAVHSRRREQPPDALRRVAP